MWAPSLEKQQTGSDRTVDAGLSYHPPSVFDDPGGAGSLC